MKTISSSEQLYNAELYYGPEQDWLELYELILGDYDENSVLTVKAAADYLLNHPSYSTGLTKKIRELERNFKYGLFFVDACPSRSGDSIFLRNGNKRSIAYAMNLMQNKEKFQPIIIRDWRNQFTREDLENLQELETTDDPVIC